MIQVTVTANSAEARARLESLLAGSVHVALAAEGGGGGDVVLMEDAQGAGELPPAPVVMVLGEISDARVVRAALRAGARGVLARESAGPREVEAAIVAAHAGLVVMTPEAAAVTQELDELAEPLSEREVEVLDLVAAGLANKLIAYRLGITEHTVKSHMSSIFAKLGAGSRTEAVSMGVRRGLVML